MRQNIITFRSIGGTVLNEFIGNRFEVERVGGVYRLRANTSARTKYGAGAVKVLMCFAQDTAGDAEAQPARPGSGPVSPSEAEVEQYGLTHLPFRSWCRHCIRAKGKEPPYDESSPGGVSKFATDYIFIGDDRTSLTIVAGFDGLTKALFANVVPSKGTSHGYAERALAHNVLSTQVIRKSSSKSTKNRESSTPNTKPARTSEQKSCTKKAQPETATQTAALNEPSKPSRGKSSQSRTTPNDRSVRRLVLTAQF